MIEGTGVLQIQIGPVHRLPWQYRLAIWLGMDDLVRFYEHSTCDQCGLTVDPATRWVVKGKRQRSLLGLLLDDGVTAVLHPACFRAWVTEGLART